MLITILSITIVLIIVIVLVVYKKEKKHQEERKKRRQQKTQHQKRKVPEIPKPKPKIVPKNMTSTTNRRRDTDRRTQADRRAERNRRGEFQAPIKELPKANYPKFDHTRMILVLGLSEDEAVEFVGDLISQLNSTIPLIQETLQKSDFEAMEALTHNIKGSSTNLGTGGIATLLTEYNTYLKTGRDLDIIKTYFQHLLHYTAELKAQYT